MNKEQKLFDDIYKIINNIYEKYKNEDEIKNNKAIRINEVIEITYNIYLTAIGFRNGTYIFDGFSALNRNNIDDIIEILKKLNQIHINLDVLYNRYLGEIYVYNKRKEKNIMKCIKWLENPKYKNKRKTNKITSYDNKRESKIAYLLSYDVVDYRNIFTSKNAILINFIIREQDKRINILGYYSYKSNINKAYERLIKLNKLLKPLNKSCSLVISDNNSI